MANITSPFELPEYARALEREGVGRLIAFHPITHTVAGFPVTPMTLRQYSLLRLVNSPFLPPFETPTTQQLIQFLWLLNPGFEGARDEGRGANGAPPSRWPVSDGSSTVAVRQDFFARARKQFIPPPPPRFNRGFIKTRWYFQRKFCELREAAAVVAAREFVEDTMADRPDAGGESGPSYYSDECSIISAIAESRGWSEEQIMAMPLTRIFQHLKQIIERFRAENGLPMLTCNPSDEVIQQHLAAANAKN